MPRSLKKVVFLHSPMFSSLPCPLQVPMSFTSVAILLIFGGVRLALVTSGRASCLLLCKSFFPLLFARPGSLESCCCRCAPHRGAFSCTACAPVTACDHVQNALSSARFGPQQLLACFACTPAAMPLPSKIQDTLARSLNNLTVVNDTVLHELAQAVPTRQADKLQLLLNKLLERAEAEASTSSMAAPSSSNLAPHAPAASSPLDAVTNLEAMDAAGGALASDDIELLAAEPEPPLEPWAAPEPSAAAACHDDQPPGLQASKPSALDGSAPPASFGATDAADPWAGWSASSASADPGGGAACSFERKHGARL